MEKTIGCHAFLLHFNFTSLVLSGSHEDKEPLCCLQIVLLIWCLCLHSTSCLSFFYCFCVGVISLLFLSKRNLNKEKNFAQMLSVTQVTWLESCLSARLPANLQHMNMERWLQPPCDCQSSDTNMEISQCAVSKHTFTLNEHITSYICFLFINHWKAQEFSYKQQLRHK